MPRCLVVRASSVLTGSHKMIRTHKRTQTCRSTTHVLEIMVMDSTLPVSSDNSFTLNCAIQYGCCPSMWVDLENASIVWHCAIHFGDSLRAISCLSSISFSGYKGPQHQISQVSTSNTDLCLLRLTLTTLSENGVLTWLPMSRYKLLVLSKVTRINEGIQGSIINH